MSKKKNRKRRPNGMDEWQTVEWVWNEQSYEQPAPVRPGIPKFDNPCRIGDRNTRNGYCMVEVHGKNYSLHRISLAKSQGKHDKNLVRLVRHLCGVKACFEPEHLREGTWTENMQDAARMGQLGTQKRNDPVLELIGETSAN